VLDDSSRVFELGIELTNEFLNDVREINFHITRTLPRIKTLLSIDVVVPSLDLGIIILRIESCLP